MHVTVIHNPAAGEVELSPWSLCAELRAAGHDPVYASTRADWRKAVQEAGDVVLAVGGDGTVAEVARRLVHRPVALAVVPEGTANNIAGALNAPGDWRDVVHGLAGAELVEWGVGVAEGPRGRRVFLEGASFGLFADVIALVKGEQDTGIARPYGAGMQLLRDLARVRERLESQKARTCVLEVAGRRVETRALLVAVMNIPRLGPQLCLAPEARPEDGTLQLVVAGEEHRAGLEVYLTERLEGRDPRPVLDVRAVRGAAVEWPTAVAHVDDRLLSDDGALSVRFEAEARALRVLRFAAG